jgi:hypothetical protein
LWSNAVDEVLCAPSLAVPPRATSAIGQMRLSGKRACRLDSGGAV